nr:J protein JJJ1-like isoform X2 [Danaus plexippus plexippus]
MAPNYSKNAVLKGTIDYFCVVCETYLKTEEDYIKHISKPTHKKNFESTQYAKEFEDECIRKTRVGYFCEFCNQLLTVLARVRLHVTESKHMNNKTLLVIERSGPDVVAFGEIVINERSWNGLNAESCAVCNTEYENEDIHKNQAKHIINLIQSTLEVDKNKNIYRKIDEQLFQCLTCNMVLGLSDRTNHFNRDDHKKQYEKCLLSNKSNNDEQNSYVTDDLKDNDINKHDKNLKDIASNEIASDKLDERNNYLFKNKQGYLLCILCSLGVKLDDIHRHRNSRMHKKNLKQHRARIAELIEAGGTDKDLFNFIKEFEENRIYINLESKTVICMKCGDILSYSVDEIKEHIPKHNIKKKIECKSRDEPSDEKDKSEDVKEKIKDTSENINVKKKDTREDVKEKIKDTSEDVKEKAKDTREDVKGKKKDTREDVKEKIKDTSEDVKEKKKETSEVVKGTLKEAERLNVQTKTHGHELQSPRDNIPDKKNTDEATEKKKLVKIKLQRQPSYKFIESTACVKYMIFNDVIINNKYCVSFESFTFRTSSGADLECQACKVLTKFSHFSTEEHIKKINIIPVITNDESEFVRQVQNDLFHCGFCNIVVSSWDNMLEHFNSLQHKNSRIESEWRKELYLYEMSKNDQKLKDYEQNIKMRLLMNMFQGMF